MSSLHTCRVALPVAAPAAGTHCRRRRNLLCHSRASTHHRPLKTPPSEAKHALAAGLLGCVAALQLSLPAQAAFDGFAFDAVPDYQTPVLFDKMKEKQKARQDELDKEIAGGNLIGDLLAKTEENKIKNKKMIENKYCARQAELGIGDCGVLSELSKEEREAIFAEAEANVPA